MKAFPLAILLLSVLPLSAQENDSAQAPPQLTAEQQAFTNLPEEKRKLFMDSLQEASRLFQQKRIFETMDALDKAEKVFDGSSEVRGDRLLVATGRRPRVQGIGLETVGVDADARGIRVDEYLRAGERLWAIGDVTGIWPLTHTGKYQGRIVAANILGEPREANYEAVPRVTYTDPQAAAVGDADGPFSATARVSEVAKTSTYTRAYADSNGYLTLVSDGERLTGAHALGPEAGEWLQQATLAIRARVPLDVLADVIQPFPTFSEIYLAAVKTLRAEIAGRQPVPA